jgi:hypothetical protein
VDLSWLPADDRDGLRQAGALTVAGQWRLYTALPDILAIAVVRNAAHRRAAANDMKFAFMS